MVNVVKGFAGNGSHVTPANWERLGAGTERKLLCSPTKNKLSIFTPNFARWNFSADNSGLSVAGINELNMNVAVGFNFNACNASG